MRPSAAETKKGIVIFLGIAFALSSIFYLLINMKAAQLYTIGLM